MNSKIKPNPNQPMRKQWKIATTRFGHTTQKVENRVIESCFTQTLKEVKRLLTNTNMLAFEKDQRDDKNDDAFALHSFICPCFYITLECDISCKYLVQYAFYKCGKEPEIRKLLSKYPLDTKANEITLKPDFRSFYHAVRGYQDKKHFYILQKFKPLNKT